MSLRELEYISRRLQAKCRAVFTRQLYAIWALSQHLGKLQPQRKEGWWTEGDSGELKPARAGVVKLADTQDLGSCALGRVGSSPTFRTIGFWGTP